MGRAKELVEVLLRFHESWSDFEKALRLLGFKRQGKEWIKEIRGQYIVAVYEPDKDAMLVYRKIGEFSSVEDLVSKLRELGVR